MLNCLDIKGKKYLFPMITGDGIKTKCILARCESRVLKKKTNPLQCLEWKDRFWPLTTSGVH